MSRRTSIFISIILIMVLSFAGCSKGNCNDSVCSESEGEIALNFKNIKDYVLIKCSWFDKNKILLAYERPGEKVKSKIAVYSFEKEEHRVIYEDFFSVECSDNIQINNKYIAYSGDVKMILFDKKSMKLIKEFAKTADVQLKSFSPNMEYIAELKKDKLIISNNNNNLEKKEIVNVSSNNSNLAWNENSSKVAIITNNYSDICIIDIFTLKKQILVGGKDIRYPERWVDLRNCTFLTGGNYILIDCLCEDNDAFIIFDYDKSSIINTIIEKGRISILKSSNRYILYTLKNDNKNNLILYDYLTNSKNVIFKTDAQITCADFSPDGKEIIIGTFLDGKQNLVLSSIK